MFTCLKCEVVFANANLQLEHFQTDWHIYNLKRKVADLPALKLDAYNKRIQAQKAKEKVEERKKMYCEYCRTVFANKKSFENHTKSKKHLENIEKKKKQSANSDSAVKNIEEERESDDEEDVEIEEVDSDEWDGDPIPINQCLFCSLESKGLGPNLKHMTKVHSFFVPDIEFCIDLKGLIAYLGEKVGCDMRCIWCNRKGRKFWTVEATQAHMNDKGHCMMKFEGETVIEYSDFYDYSKSYPDSDNPNVSPDDAVEPYTICDNGYELMLPSGTIIGHRSLLRYYRQRLNPARSLVPHKGHYTSMHQKIMNLYKALDWKGSSREEIAKKARDMNYMKRMQSKQFMKLGVKANKFMPHFRRRDLC